MINILAIVLLISDINWHDMHSVKVPAICDKSKKTETIWPSQLYDYSPPTLEEIRNLGVPVKPVYLEGGDKVYSQGDIITGTVSLAGTRTQCFIVNQTRISYEHLYVWSRTMIDMNGRSLKLTDESRGEEIVEEYRKSRGAFEIPEKNAKGDLSLQLRVGGGFVPSQPGLHKAIFLFYSLACHKISKRYKTYTSNRDLYAAIVNSARYGDDLTEPWYPLSPYKIPGIVYYAAVDVDIKPEEVDPKAATRRSCRAAELEAAKEIWRRDYPID